MSKACSSCMYGLAALLFLFNSCELIDSKEAIPSYLRIESFEVLIPPSEQSTYGTKSNKITDAWIYLDDNLLGVFEIPTSIPILEKELSSIIIRPGIKKNGISSDGTIYPFYTFFEHTINLEPDSTHLVLPQISYQKNIIVWKKDFDGVGIGFFPKNNLSGNIDFLMDSSKIFREPGEPNKASASLSFSDSTNLLEIISLPVDLSTISKPVYLEMNYSINYPLNIGVYLGNPAKDAKYYKMVLNANRIDENAKWNKIYIELSDLLSTALVNEFSLFFEANRTGSVEKEEIFVDNIKILGRDL